MPGERKALWPHSDSLLPPHIYLALLSFNAFSPLELDLPDLANENIGCPVQFEFQKSTNNFFSISISSVVVERNTPKYAYFI
jgi:hypothetical protein